MEKELTIAQALRKIKELKGKLAKHSANAAACVTHKTKQVPAYGFSAEVEVASVVVDEMLDLQTRVAVANAKTTIDWAGKPRPLAWATKKLAETKAAISWHQNLNVRAQAKTSEEEFDYVRNANGVAEHVRVETEFTCHLPEVEKAARIQKLETQFADLNDLVETMNHRTLV